jgi:Glycine rich protein
MAAAAVLAMGFGPGRAVAAGPVDHRMAPDNYQAQCGSPDLATGTRTCTYTFPYTGTIETFVVPPTTAPVEITAVGAPGSGDPGLRSRGATVTGTFGNLSGVPIFITVGGEGAYDGYNGGGPGGGGGASDVRVGAPDLEHRILVAGGGGGAGEQLVFDQQLGTTRLVAVPGGDAGQPGLGAGGQPGTRNAGGAGGGTDYAPGRPGSFGRGGAGADGLGGGGGGYYGGGGGGGCAGSDENGTALCVDAQPGSGGGGSSLLPPGATFMTTDDPTPRITVTVTQYGWWHMP